VTVNVYWRLEVKTSTIMMECRYNYACFVGSRRVMSRDLVVWPGESNYSSSPSGRRCIWCEALNTQWGHDVLVFFDRSGILWWMCCILTVKGQQSSYCNTRKWTLFKRSEMTLGGSHPTDELLGAQASSMKCHGRTATEFSHQCQLVNWRQ
jgi:hypothetical protein